MTDSAPQLSPLLTLPRELRNLIYSHLPGEEEPDWSETSLFPTFCLLYRVHNAPTLALLHAHPRLREECLDIIEKQGVSVTLCDRDRLQPCHIDAPHQLPPIRKRRTLPLDTLFTRYIRHVTILVPNSHEDVNEWTWNTTRRFVSVLAPKTPFLATIRIEYQYRSQTLLQHHNNTYARFDMSPFMLVPPSYLDTLQLVQRVEGYRLEQEPISESEHRSPRRRHRCLTYGCYLFSKAGVDYISHLWKPEDVNGRLWVKPYDVDDWRTPLPAWVVNHKLKDWREKRGHEEAVAWF